VFVCVCVCVYVCVCVSCVCACACVSSGGSYEYLECGQLVHRLFDPVHLSTVIYNKPWRPSYDAHSGPVRCVCARASV
jgi:hypothetical protein